MLAGIRRRLASDEGFTLIELMVVVLIIAILLAIAVPTYLGSRSRAQNRAAESNLRNALTVEKAAYTDSQVYPDATSVAPAEPSLTFVTTTPTAARQVEVTPSEGGSSLCLIVRSDSGGFYGIFEEALTTGWIAGGTYYASWSSAPACPTGAFSAGSGSGWYTTAAAASW